MSLEKLKKQLLHYIVGSRIQRKVARAIRVVKIRRIQPSAATAKRKAILSLNTR
jgi:hypothetical protein